MEPGPDPVPRVTVVVTGRAALDPWWRGRTGLADFTPDERTALGRQDRRYFAGVIVVVMVLSLIRGFKADRPGRPLRLRSAPTDGGPVGNAHDGHGHGDAKM